MTLNLNQPFFDLPDDDTLHNFQRLIDLEIQNLFPESKTQLPRITNKLSSQKQYKCPLFFPNHKE